MKTCPRCKMTVDAHAQCPICGTDVLNEPYVEAKGERYVLNKFFFLHLLKSHTYSLICLVVVLIRVATLIPNLNYYCLWAVTFAVVSLLMSLFKNRMIEWESSKYTETHSELRMIIGRYVLGGVAVLLSLFLHLL